MINELIETDSKLLTMAIAIAIGVLVFFISIFILRKLARRIVPQDQYEQFKRHPVTWLIPVVIGLIIVVIEATVFMQNSGDGIGHLWQAVVLWGSQHGVTVLLIVLTAFILSRVLNFIIPPALSNFVKVRCKGRSEKEEIRRRSEVLSKFLIHIGEGTIYVIAIFMILSELGVNITPMLAGAGVIGIAVGLGSQKLIGDLINGAFIMLEDYYSTGDVVQVAGISGLVEEVDIRRTILRDLDGVVHIIPNGEIKIASNFTRNWSRVNINIPVSYNEDLDRVIAVLNKVGLQLSKDEQYRNMIITPPQVLRVDNFGDSAIEIKMLGETKPIKQWEVTGELRKRIKKAFDEEHIEIPWPHTKVYFGNDPNTAGENPPSADHVKFKAKRQQARKTTPPIQDTKEAD
ncbi:MAG: mechanosensitive ion channel family protein [Dehalococcoidia bacterium]|nr:MAG: mechanosensitive ion channel family protein [Dehalococcoidia bacterium]